MNSFIVCIFLGSFNSALFSGSEGARVESPEDVSSNEDDMMDEPDIWMVQNSEDGVVKPEHRRKGRTS